MTCVRNQGAISNVLEINEHFWKAVSVTSRQEVKFFKLVLKFLVWIYIQYLQYRGQNSRRALQTSLGYKCCGMWHWSTPINVK